MNSEPVPPIIDSGYVRAYASIGPGIRYTGKQCIIVDGNVVGPAAKIAVCENGPNDFLLLLCNDDWSSYACASYVSLTEAIETVEAYYEGVTSVLTYTNFTPYEDAENIKEYWKGYECSFCGELPTDYENSFQSNGSVICFDCVRRLHELIAKTDAHDA